MYKSFLSLIILLLTSFAQAEINENPMTINSSFLSKQTINVNEEIELKIKVQLAPKHHAYSKQFKIKPKIGAIEVRKILINPQIDFYDNLAKKNKMGIKDLATLTTSFEVPKQLKPGSQKLNFDLQYQACTKEYCLMPIDIPFSIDVNVINSEYKEEKKSFSLTSLDLNQDNTSLTFILLAIFFAGFLTSFTPCIYPMIPITLAVLGNSKTENSVMKKLMLSLSYVFGIAITYSLLGVIAATTGGLFGSYLNHPLVRVGIGIMFIFMALSMFGVFELQAPAFIRNHLSNKKFKQNYVGAFLTGLVAGIIASPCVGPVLVSILTYVAQSGNAYLGFLYLFTFALGLGVIFICIGLFSHLLDKLPRSGSWMDITKYVFGCIMLAAATYYLMPALDKPFKNIAPIITTLIALDFARRIITKKKIKYFFYVLLSPIIIYFGLMLVPTFESQLNQTIHSKSKFTPNWVPYSSQIYEQAKKENKGLIIDFYADWCAACIELEEKTFSTKDVYELAKNFIWVKYDATNQPADYEIVRDKYQIQGLPHIVFYNQKGDYKEKQTLFGFEDKIQFIERLNKVLK